MTNGQSSITKFFIETVNKLIDKGELKGYKELAEKLDWNRTSLSNVINGRINVPTEVYKKFAEMYGTDTVAQVDSPTSIILQKVVQMQATQRVFLMVFAELLAKERGVSIATVLSELEVAVNQQVKAEIEKL